MRERVRERFRERHSEEERERVRESSAREEFINQKRENEVLKGGAIERG